MTELSPLSPSVRLDIWLWAARFFKTRSLAKQAIETGKVSVAGQRPKSSRAVRVGEQLQVDHAAGIEVGAVGIRCEHLQARALRVDHVARCIGLEVAGARVHAGAVHVHGEEAFTGNSHVQAAAGLFVVALLELLGDIGNAHARADRVLRQAIAGGREQVGEFGARFLEAGGVDVGDVVGSDAQVGIGGIDAGQRDIEAHGMLLVSAGCAAQLTRST